jgi:hypothetical protein
MLEDNKVSDWNEANFKMKRLHDIQERLNFFKRNPKGFTDGKFNYEWWIKEIELLFGEGQSKYNDTEKKECNRIKKIIETFLSLKAPTRKIIVDTAGRSNNGYVFNDESFNILLRWVEEYEDFVKKYNDKHGLSTRNKETGGMFG